MVGGFGGTGMNSGSVWQEEQLALPSKMTFPFWAAGDGLPSASRNGLTGHLRAAHLEVEHELRGLRVEGSPGRSVLDEQALRS